MTCSQGEISRRKGIPLDRPWGSKPATASLHSSMWVMELWRVPRVEARAVPPPQQEIDGGGFQVVTSTPTYLYVQFESLKAGYIDDVEFAVHQAFA